MCEALNFLLDNIYIRFGSKLYRQIVGIPMDTNCAPLAAHLFLICNERDFKLIHAISHTVRQNLTEFIPYESQFPEEFSNLTEFLDTFLRDFMKK